ncbi:MAG TPA: hypothetical protein VGR84_01355 [Candidatus Acidoferrales bacterium]|nr:hypothetical protein [Candidatus Acidoferrales bacterium]
MDLSWLWQALSNNWGSMASVLGLGVSIATFLVAKRAKTAAEDAKREARRRNLSEDLQDARTKSEQAGLFINETKWDIVFVRSQEIASICSLVLKRWSDELSEASKEQIRLARDEASSISRVATRASVRQPSESQLRSLTAAQRKLNELLSSELGESLKVIERSGQPR